MKLNIKVVAKGGTRATESVCPWVLDIPPTAPRA
jgi:hypothetical protein